MVDVGRRNGHGDGEEASYYNAETLFFLAYNTNENIPRQAMFD